MDRIKRNTVCAAILATAVFFALYYGRNTKSNGRHVASVDPPKVQQPGHQGEPSQNQVLSNLEEILATNRTANAPSQEVMAAVRSLLEAFPKKEASEGVRAFLDSKRDLPSGMGFKIGADGFLTASPSLRVFLLDYLSRIDPTNAAAYAHIILLGKDSADEWAIALRTLATFNSEAGDQTFVSQKVGELLAYEPWIERPTVGFLESFDIAVYLGGADHISTLAGLAGKKDNQAVSQAAFLALDRLTINDPTTTLSYLESHPETMASREETRANYFARANVLEVAQRDVLERYLLNPALSPAELNRFAGLYPNANFMVSHNLLTPVVTPSGQWLQARDAEALRLVREWEGDTRFARLKPQLLAIRQRLESFTKPPANSR